MAKKGFTIFQKLDNAISGNWQSNTRKHTNVYNMPDSYQNKVIYRTDNIEDYNTKKLELQQNAYLNNRWVKANVDLTIQSYSGLNNIKLMYRDAELMDSFPEIGAALDIVSEEACLTGNMKIELLSGNVCTIEQLYKHKIRNFWCYAVDELGKRQPTKVDKVIYKGVRVVYEITLDDNTVLECTNNHKWLNSDLIWKTTKELNEGDKLLTLSESHHIMMENNICQISYTDNKIEQHKIVSIKKTERKEKVFDLLNSTVNSCFGIKCNNGLVISHNCCLSDKGHVVNVYSKSDRIKNILEDLFINRLNMQVIAPMIIRAMCKYGNQFMLLNIDNKNGITGWKQLPVYNIERVENGVINPYGVPQNNDKDELSTEFLWINENSSQIPFRNWQIGHFRLLTDSLYLPYGVSYLNKARRHWRMLSLMEDMMLIYRLERSIERRVYKIYVGAIDDADVKSYVEDIANNFKRTPIIDPLTGQVDLRKNLLSVDQDIFIPVRDPNAATPIDTLQAAQNLTAMDDIKFVQNKVLTALRMPKSFLNFEEATGDGKNLALMDIRFTRTVNRIQQAFLMELNKIAMIHLFILGFNDDLTNFSLSMNNPSTQAEQLEIENIQKKILVLRDAVTDPGNGIPIMSQRRALRQIMKWSDKEIQDNLEEIRLEKAIAAELEKTNQIIKRTKVFDIVDNIYGEPNAKYQEENEGGMNNGDSAPIGGGGGGGFGGLDIGGSNDLSSEIDTMGEGGSDKNNEAPEIKGNDTEVPMGKTETKETNPPTMPTENSIRTKPLILERKSKDLISDANNKKEIIMQRADIIDKSLMINEELNELLTSMLKIKNDKKIE